MITCSTARNGASSSTYITARAKNVATSESTLTTGLRWRMTTSAKMTAMAAKVKKTTNSIIRCELRVARCELADAQLATGNSQPRSYPPSNDEKRHQNDVHHGQRQEHLPAEVHQQVVLEARNGPAHPDEDEQQETDFDQERQQGDGEAERRRRLVVPRHVPPPQEEGGDHRGHGR